MKAASQDPQGPAQEDELDALRDLLVGPEKRRLLDLELRGKNVHLNARSVGEVLPDAVLLRAHRDDRLARTLAHSVPEALNHAVSAQPEAVGRALAPATAAIVRAAWDAWVVRVGLRLRDLVSPKHWRARWVSAHGGRHIEEWSREAPIIWAVESAAFVHLQSGALLARARNRQLVPNHAREEAALTQLRSALFEQSQLAEVPTEEASDPDNGSVKFRRNPATQIVELRGARAICGSKAAVLVLLRGAVPRELDAELWSALHEFERVRARELTEFEGDRDPFFGASVELEDLLFSKSRPTDSRAGAILPWLLGGGLALLLGWFAFQWVSDRNSERNWQIAVDALRKVPGVVVLGESRNGSGGRIEGFRDPLTEPPEELWTGSDPGQITWDFEPLLSQVPELVLQRARQRLEPPVGVHMRLEDGRLQVLGRADHAWLRSLPARLTGLAGVDGLDLSEVTDEGLQALEAAIQNLDERFLIFEPEESTWRPHSNRAKSLLADVAELAAIAGKTGMAVQFQMCGTLSSDEAAGSVQPLELALKRALSVEEVLAEVVSGELVYSTRALKSGELQGARGELPGVLLRISTIGEIQER